MNLSEAKALTQQWANFKEIVETQQKDSAANKIKSEFLAMVKESGLLAQLAADKEACAMVIAKVNQLPGALFTQDFFDAIFNAPWKEEANRSQSASGESTPEDLLWSLNPFKNFQFFSPMNADQNLKTVFAGTNVSFVEKMLQANKAVPARPLYKAMAQYQGYVDVQEGSLRTGADIVLVNAVSTLLDQEDFDVVAYYRDSNTSLAFKNLPVVKVAVAQEQQLIDLFDTSKTEKDLTKGAKGVESLHHEGILIHALMTTHKQSLLALTTKTELNAVEHKRIKRLVELLDQVSATGREKLVDPKLSLAILKCVSDTYAHNVDSVEHNLKRGLFGATKSDKKLAFLQFIQQDFANRLADGQNGVTVSLNKFTQSSDSVMWKAYVAVEKKEPASMEVVNTWLRTIILPGTETKKALSWLPENYLQHIATGTGDALVEGAAVLEEAANTTNVNDNVNAVTGTGNNDMGESSTVSADTKVKRRLSIQATLAVNSGARLNMFPSQQNEQSHSAATNNNSAGTETAKKSVFGSLTTWGASTSTSSSSSATSSSSASNRK